jgi:hypothetical protein
MVALVDCILEELRQLRAASWPVPTYRPSLHGNEAMNTQRLLIALTVVNVALLTFALVRPGAARTDDVAPVLRGRALEIVDDRGRVRASISVLAADPTVKMPDGAAGYPETVLPRLSTSGGRPNVKLAARDDGAGLVLGGEADPTYVQVLARGLITSLKLSNKDGREQIIKP